MKTSEIAIILIVGTLTLLVFVFFIILIIIEYRRRQVKYITEKLEMEHRFKQEVLQTQIEVQEQSFQYISEEIHDNIAQTLSLARIKLFKTTERATDEAQKASLHTTTELVGNALEGLRSLSHVLNGGLVQQLPLKDSLEKELKYVKDANEIETELRMTGEYRELEAGKKLVAFRVVQEALNNSIKHSHASRISINLEYSPQKISIGIEDNGKGFDVAHTQSRGLGMYNMEMRAAMLGDLQIASREGKGTTVTLNIRTDE
ncbi:MAG: hypothetical protein KF744_09910 [Taibaiella sp.]|nr:hypothetical protein [Taibaiella sp.]